MDIVAFQAQDGASYNPFRLLIALDRDPHTFCAFRARWRVTTAAELVPYLQFTVALAQAFAIHRNEVGS